MHDEEIANTREVCTPSFGIPESRHTLPLMGNKAPEPAKPASTSCGAKATEPVLGKSGKKICCSCPATREKRDACVVLKGESACKELVEAHNACLRAEGFNV